MLETNWFHGSILVFVMMLIKLLLLNFLYHDKYLEKTVLVQTDWTIVNQFEEQFG